MSRVLVVEDNELNMMLARDILSYGGHEVVGAVSVREARACLKGPLPDVVLTDLRLPDASGEDLLAEIRSDPALAHLPVVALTASAMHGDRERLLAMGFDGYISKPIDTRALAKDVRAFAALGERRRKGGGNT